jgi:hypothetical protein
VTLIYGDYLIVGLVWVPIPHELRLVPLGITADPARPPPVTLEALYAAQLLPHPKALFLRIASAEKGDPTDGIAPGLTVILPVAWTAMAALLKSITDPAL